MTNQLIPSAEAVQVLKQAISRLENLLYQRAVDKGFAETDAEAESIAAAEVKRYFEALDSLQHPLYVITIPPPDNSGAPAYAGPPWPANPYMHDVVFAPYVPPCGTPCM